MGYALSVKFQSCASARDAEGIFGGLYRIVGTRQLGDLTLITSCPFAHSRSPWAGEKREAASYDIPCVLGGGACSRTCACCLFRLSVWTSGRLSAYGCGESDGVGWAHVVADPTNGRCLCTSRAGKRMERNERPPAGGRRRRRLASTEGEMGCAVRGRRLEGFATWLILPVVICLSQRLSHACASMNDFGL
jgi:hypothetical protein